MGGLQTKTLLISPMRSQSVTTTNGINAVGQLAGIYVDGAGAHGYFWSQGVTAHIQRVSEELLRVEEGSLYPALHRMEQDGWIRAEWGMTEKNREARFYSLTPRGRKQLIQEQESWARLTEGVERVIRFA